MGLNSIHAAPKDFIWCENKTNNTKFKASIVKKGYERMSVCQGITSDVITCVLVVHGHCEIKTNDYIKVPFFKDNLKVINWDDAIDESLARRRCDFENFTGQTTIVLS